MMAAPIAANADHQRDDLQVPRLSRSSRSASAPLTPSSSPAWQRSLRSAGFSRAMIADDEHEAQRRASPR